ncbi:MAG TPA: hypothetical protein VFJ14_07885 [Nocardioidaceae bacterium]|nr:hypothetical protein [Nocardioidaceae bacterium]
MSAEQPIPPPDRLPRVHSDNDPLDRWRLWLADECFGTRSLWVLWFDDRDLQMPIATPIDEAPRLPDPIAVENLALVAEDVLGEAGGRWVSLALVRPGWAADLGR